MSESERTLAIRVEGRVQGVGYRAFTEREAKRRAVSGWVVNRPDGAVEAVLCGHGAALAEVIARLRDGPPAACVETLDVRSTDRAAAAHRPAGAHVF